MSVYAYNPNVFANVDRADLQLWRSLYKFISYAVSFVDRTGTIQIPIHTETPQHLAMPEYDPNFSMTYEECCDHKVSELIELQDRLDIPIRIMYSGGIDSSLILISFIKRLGVDQTSRRVEVFLDQESIQENPALWHKFILPYFRIVDSDRYGTRFDKQGILIGGEGNDQLFGSDIYKDVIRWGGNKILDTAWTEGLIRDYFKYKKLTQAESDVWFEQFSRLINAAQCSIVTIADWWWYINLTCKWASVYHRMLFYVTQPQLVNNDYIETYFQQFFNTDHFQRWSLVNRDQKHQGDYLSYKFHARDLIADFLNDTQYRLKIKRPSLGHITRFRYACDLIERDYNFRYQINPLDYYNPTNSFTK